MAEGKTILVVDDDPDVRYLCQTILSAAGFIVKTADSGANGLQEVEQHPPDLMILDIIMERIDSGYSVAEQLAGRIPIILFSSITNESDEVFDPASLPVRAVLSKPIDSKILIQKVHEILG